MTIHIFTAEPQPATRYRDHVAAGRRWTFTNPARRKLWAQCCQRPRIAANLCVQVYYYGHRFICKHGTGCKKGKK